MYVWSTVSHEDHNAFFRKIENVLKIDCTEEILILCNKNLIIWNITWIFEMKLDSLKWKLDSLKWKLDSLKRNLHSLKWNLDSLKWKLNSLKQNFDSLKWKFDSWKWSKAFYRRPHAFTNHKLTISFPLLPHFRTHFSHVNIFKISHGLFCIRN